MGLQVSACNCYVLPSWFYLCPINVNHGPAQWGCKRALNGVASAFHCYVSYSPLACVYVCVCVHACVCVCVCVCVQVRACKCVCVRACVCDSAAIGIQSCVEANKSYAQNKLVL